MGNNFCSTPKNSVEPIINGKIPNSTANKDSVNDQQDMNKNRRCEELENALRGKENEVKRLQEELRRADSILYKKSLEVRTLVQEVDKLKSVLQETVHGGHQNMLEVINEQNIEKNPSCGDLRKTGISGESSGQARQSMTRRLKKFEKDFRTKQLIKQALVDNEMLRNLNMVQIKEIVDCAYPKLFQQAQKLITEGETGSHLYISAEGEFEVSKEGTVIGYIGAGKVIGELALLYHCRRTATVKAVSRAKVWLLDRQVFQIIMMKTNMERQQETIAMLKSVPVLKTLQREKLAKIADALELGFFNEGEFIVRQGAAGEIFFIIYKGQVKVTRTAEDHTHEVRLLKRGEYFGEKALLSEEVRTANVIALPPGVECLTLDRYSFLSLIGDISEIRQKEYGDEMSAPTPVPNNVTLMKELSSPDNEFSHIELNHLQILSTLGVGGFGRVELVQNVHDREQTFALKCLIKQHIVETHQEEHVFSEKFIMQSTEHPFIARLYKTFKDNKYLYMLIEPCLGGEIWSILRDSNRFNDNTARFYVAAVTLAIQYLHDRGIIYRDLKPENLLLDSHGYPKLVDFGFAKQIGLGHKTWTFCGTQEYVCPEIILNKGHSFAVDIWAIGILSFELLTGNPPFAASDPMKTYNLVLRGIDEIVFPRYVNRNAANFIRRLCRENPADRLGNQSAGFEDLYTHRWFNGFDWEGLRSKSLKPPVIPKVTGPADFSNFDKFPKESKVPPDELSGWDEFF